MIIAGVIGGYFYFFAEKKPTFGIVAAQKGRIVREASATGKVKAAEEADLAFEKSGRIVSVAVSETETAPRPFSNSVILKYNRVTRRIKSKTTPFLFPRSLLA
ncbi:MAG: hypothetical protein HZA37_02645 [Parcubacteria group bacterium]|nr:hypothetical protein [Parcubacteria group bacterium]